MTRVHDAFLMGVALDLARRGLGGTSPNPAVGCVISRQGQIVGRGFHAAAGEPHAEVHALREAGDAAFGADIFVTLEPCSHHGRTPPCAEALVRAAPRRVVVAMLDPNPQVAGQGVERLRRAGIAVEVGILEREARELNEAFCLSIRERRSFVHLKLAGTLDGKTATRSGDSRWISSPESRRRVHELRDRCGVVVVGVGTAEADDPKLTVRLPDRAERRILRVVLDPSLRCPTTLQMLAKQEAQHTLLVCSTRAPADRIAHFRELGSEVLQVPALDGRLALHALLSMLYEKGFMEVLVEGGSETARHFLDQRLVDRLHLFTSFRLLGGRDAVPLIGGQSPERIADAWQLRDEKIDRVGPDLYVSARLAWEQ